MTRLFDRQAGETSKAYEAFALYRDMGVNRTHEAVANKLSKSTTLMGRWSSDYNWIERAAAYDDYVDAEARKKLERDAIKRKADMLRRHALTGKVMQQKGTEYLQKKGIDRSSDAVTAISKGIDIERKSEGLPEWIFEVVNADDSELARQFADLYAQISGYAGGDDTPGDGDSGPDPAAETPTPAHD